jgi:hypothetical protein
MNRSARTLLAAVALVLGTAGTAAAQSQMVKDNPADAPGSINDISSVKVEHTKKYVVIVTEFSDLQPTSDGASSLAMFVDLTDSKGPELRLSTGLQEGTDYQLVSMYEGQPQGDPLTCPHQVKVNFDSNIVRAKIDRFCTGSAAKVRVGVKMTDHTEDGLVTDWLKKKNSYTKWLKVA